MVMALDSHSLMFQGKIVLRAQGWGRRRKLGYTLLKAWSDLMGTGMCPPPANQNSPLSWPQNWLRNGHRAHDSPKRVNLGTFVQTISGMRCSQMGGWENSVLPELLGASCYCWKSQLEWVQGWRERLSPDETEPLYPAVPKALFCYMSQYAPSFYFLKPLAVRFLLPAT